jgi:hypothetical protein
MILAENSSATIIKDSQADSFTQSAASSATDKYLLNLHALLGADEASWVALVAHCYYLLSR